MKPNKNIDRLFQEKLRDLEVTPPDVVWETIEAKLNRKKKRRVIPIWLRYGGVAVLLILLTILGINYSRTSGNANPIENSITDTKPTEERIVLSLLKLILS